MDNSKIFDITIVLPKDSQGYYGCLSNNHNETVKIGHVTIYGKEALACVYFHELLHLKHYLESQVENNESNKSNDPAYIPYLEAKNITAQNKRIKNMNLGDIVVR